MQELIWYLRVHTGFELASPFALPLVIGFSLYQIHYLVLIIQSLYRLVRHGRKAPPVPAGRRPSAVVVMPTLLRNEDELAGLQKAMTSAATNGYPGELIVVAAIDDGVTKADLFAALQTWTAAFEAPPGVRLMATCTKKRTGKAVAIDNGVLFLEEQIAAGNVKEMPTLFFNMDADSILGPEALVRLADRLTTRYPGSEQYPNIVTSNVSIARSEYWRGWRSYFTVRGQVSIHVAAEFILSMLGKHNYKLHLVPGASGALYCTWSKLHLLGPRWAAFMTTLSWKDVGKWWLGKQPPVFETADCGRLPEGMTGPGDDTWVTWLAYIARWSNGSLTVELPRTPAHALWYMMRGYVFRGLQYESHAVVETKTPTTIKALFKQRVRWNTSRVELSQRWSKAVPFHWTLLFPTVISTFIIVYFNAVEALGMILLPFASSKGFFVGFCCAFVVYSFMRFVATAFGIWLDGGFKKHGHKLLGLALSVPYHFVFNKLTTFWGYVQDVFLFGVNTGFSPEETHIRGKAPRFALAYRARRFLHLCVRSVIHNDVPLGWFWFGWFETEFTPSGFEGWTSGKRRVLKPRVIPAAVTTEVLVPGSAEVVAAPTFAAVAEQVAPPALAAEVAPLSSSLRNTPRPRPSLCPPSRSSKGDQTVRQAA